LLIQAADILLGNFGAPECVFKSFTALLLLAFRSPWCSPGFTS
jgi:hypothetical protein